MKEPFAGNLISSRCQLLLHTPHCKEDGVFCQCIKSAVNFFLARANSGGSSESPCWNSISAFRDCFLYQSCQFPCKAIAVAAVESVTFAHCDMVNWCWGGVRASSSQIAFSHQNMLLLLLPLPGLRVSQVAVYCCLRGKVKKKIQRQKQEALLFQQERKHFASASCCCFSLLYCFLLVCCDFFVPQRKQALYMWREQL